MLAGGPLKAQILPGLRNRMRRLVGMAPERKKRFVTPALDLEGFFSELDRRQVRYVVLRWFDRLPYIRPGGDLDLLIADEDLDRIADLFVLEGTLACDRRTVSGLPGTSFVGKPYFPPARAREVLERAERMRDLCMVPSPWDHFHSLAYHTVYQKGLKAGLPTSRPGLTTNPDPEHDYRAILAGLARDVGVDVEVSMEGLDAYLAGQGWKPDLETLSLLSRRDPWVAAEAAEARKAGNVP